MKKINKSNSKKIILSFVVLSILFLNVLFILPNKSIPDLESNKFSNKKIKSSQDYVEDEFTEEWLDNGDFTGGIEPWENETKNDKTGDLNASYTKERANYEILGRKGKKEVILDTNNYNHWEQFQKTDPQLEPNGGFGASGIDSTGAHTSHDFDDDAADQTPIIFWRTNVSFDVDMSDYEISSADLSANISADVSENVDVEGDTVDQPQSYDYCQFFIEVADLDVSTYNTYEIALTQPPNLGRDNGDPNPYLSIEEFIETKSEQAIIDSLENVLEVDPGNNNFTLIIGIYIHCADNDFSTDSDNWNDLRFHSVNLTFTYEKKINPSSSLSWNQVMNKLPKNTDSIKNAILKFDYLANASWPTISPNSEFRIIINGSQFRETIKLNDSRTYSQPASFDVSSLIPLDYNISLKIQLYIADDFNLNKTIKISIDNASLLITYVTTTLESPTNVDLLLNGFLDESIEVPYGDKINITLIYKNATSKEFIPEASVRLRGAKFDVYLENNTQFDHYNMTIDSKNLEFGNNYMRIDASKKYFETNTTLFTITVRDRNAIIDKVFLDNKLDSDKQIEVPYGDFLDINVTYLDQDSQENITQATVKLRNGTNAIGEFDQIFGEQYNFTLNTSLLVVGVNFLTVTAELSNYTSDSETITVIIGAKGTISQLYINDTDHTENLYKAIEANQFLNISLEYNQTNPNQFLSGARVTLNGSGISKLLNENGYNYSTEISTSDLNQGINFLTIYASQDGFIPQSFSLTIEVVQELTNYSIYINKTDYTSNPYKVAQVDNFLNISFGYKDKDTENLIPGATISINGSGVSELLLSNGKNYTMILNTNDLNQGVNFLTIYATATGYQPQSLTLTIEIVQKLTDLNLYINDTSTTIVDPIYELDPLIIGDRYNITVYYFDEDSNAILTAGVNLTGTNFNEEFKDHSNGNYSILLNSTDNRLSWGVNYLTILAQKDNYEPQTLTLRFEIIVKETNLNLYLDNVNQTDNIDKGVSKNLDWNEILKINVEFLDYNGDPIKDGIVQAESGEYQKTFNLPTISNYTNNLNSSDLGVGVHYLTIIAERDNYQPQTITIRLEIGRRNTDLTSFIEHQQRLDFSTYWNETFLLELKYNDSTLKSVIEGAIVDINGSGISNLFGWNESTRVYNLTVNSAELSIGINYLTITASKENYTSETLVIRIEVKVRETALEIFINGNDETLDKSYSTYWNESIRFLLYYSDFKFSSNISHAIVDINGSGISEILNPLNQGYVLEINSSSLNIGVNYLTFTASKDNYSSKTILLKIEIKNRLTNMQLFINGTNKTVDKTAEAYWGETINIDISYQDVILGTFIKNSNVQITGSGISEFFNEEHDIYTISLYTSSLEIGFNYFTVSISKNNYQTITLAFSLEILERESELQIFLNGVNKTSDKFIELPINSNLNITVIYQDSKNFHPISNASLELVGEGFSRNFTHSKEFVQYSILINTKNLDIGIRFLTISAQRQNFQSTTASLRIDVKRISTQIFLSNYNESTIESQPGENVILKVELRDLDFNKTIQNATVRYTWELGQGELTDVDNDGIYTATLNNVPEGTYILTVSVYAGDDYDFERYRININVIRPPTETFLYQVLTIVGIASAIGIGGYLVAYQRVLKYPQPVRKIHKYRNKLTKAKSPGVSIRSRDEILKELYKDELEPLEQEMKGSMKDKLKKASETADTQE
jgi:hypothetical protein